MNIRVRALGRWGEGKRPSAGGEGHMMTYAVEKRGGCR